MRPGPCYRPASRELAVIPGDEALPGRGWQPPASRCPAAAGSRRRAAATSGSSRCVRLLVERGVAGNGDARAYYWHMPPTEGSETSVFKVQASRAQAS